MNLKQSAAYLFAEARHQGQVRKYTAEPYINHPLEVAEYLVQHAFEHGLPDGIDLSVMKDVALLHDTVEDTETSFLDISREFGEEVCEHVFWLTDTVDLRMGGNRAVRKRLAAKRLARAPDLSKAVKIADLTNNTVSIVEHDPNFARTYLKEKVYTLDCIAQGLPPGPFFRELLRKAYAQVIVD